MSNQHVIIEHRRRGSTDNWELATPCPVLETQTAPVLKRIDQKYHGRHETRSREVDAVCLPSAEGFCGQPGIL